MKYIALSCFLLVALIANAQIDTATIKGVWHIHTMQANGIVFDYKNTDAAVNTFLERQQKELGKPLTKADTTKAKFDIAAYVAEQPLNNIEFKDNRVITFRAALSDAPTYGEYYWTESDVLSFKENNVLSGIFKVVELSKTTLIIELLNEVQMEVNGKIILSFNR